MSGVSVRLEPVRSAEPPSSSGSCLANKPNAICDALREATPSALRSASASACLIAAGNALGNSAFQRRCNSLAKSG